MTATTTTSKAAALIAAHEASDNKGERAQMSKKIIAHFEELKNTNQTLLDKQDKGTSLLASEQRQFDANTAEMVAVNAWSSEPDRNSVDARRFAEPADDGFGFDLPRVPNGFESVPPEGFGAALAKAKFDIHNNRSVNVPGFQALGMHRRARNASTLPSFEVLKPTTPTMVPLGTDNRFLFPFLNTQDAGDASSIDDFKQTARTVTGTVRRLLDATTDKALLDITVTTVNEELSQSAVFIENIPNAMFSRLPQLSALLRSQGEFELYKDIDTHVLSQIVASTPPFGNTGTTTIDKVRNALTSMRATGANPTILVINPTDLAALDLFRVGGSTTTDGPYAYDFTQSPSHPLWGLKVIERIGGGSDPMYLIDPEMLGVLYIGQMHFDADPFTGFRKNLTNLRIEVDNLFHVRNANGARRIAVA